ncbi:MAG: ABC transporter ATP-binding protein [Nitrososphaerota archaeon]|nr:ABC transporter ATP-binding protein [Nitrososphaerota archaeon]
MDFIMRRPARYIRAVDKIDFDIKVKEVFVLAGESGCGKTTTARLILRSIEPDEGSIIFDGMNVNKLKGRELKRFRRLAQIVFQDPYASLNPRLTVFDCLLEPLMVHNVEGTGGERKERVYKAMEEVKLLPIENFERKYPHMLSGGQRQRLAIARALILRPKLIVADEPVSMLDLSIRAEILDLMIALRDKYDITYLYITHDLSTARYVGDKIAIMYLGKIVEMGPCEIVLSDPLHPYTQALIDAIIEPDPTNRFRERKVRIMGDIPNPLEIPKGCRLHPRCPYTMEKCSLAEPPLIEFKPSHYVACYLYS